MLARNIRLKVLLAAMVALLLWPVGDVAQLHADSGARGVHLVEENVRIFAPRGRYAISAKILRPQGPGPFGGIVLSHGVPMSAAARRLESPEQLLYAAAHLARRGYAVVMPLRRGFGATGGPFAEDPGSCRAPDFLRGEAAAAEDIMAAYHFTRRLPYVDGDRMILAGQSAGGVASLFAAGAHAPQGLVAVLAFAPGRGGNPLRHPGAPCALEPLAEVFAGLGAHVKAPVLFHYAENDLFFSPQASRLWFERFRRGGARAEYVLQPPFGRDGHYIFSDDLGARYWVPQVERFLKEHGVPFDAMAV